MILSEIEQRIKSKIESIGTPLRDWDISIYRGVLTGYNEAFIIDGETKNALIKADPKSGEIIRPVLRGRDIKRYSYQFANLYLIATFPSKRYDIDRYPAIKEHLLGFGYDRLNQTGENGARKKTNNKWFETQDSIGYWDDFSKPKIVWGNLNLDASYSYASEGTFIIAPCNMIVPFSHYLLGILNSSVADFYIRGLGVTRNGGYFEYKPMFVEQLPVPLFNETAQKDFASIVDEIHLRKERNHSTFQLEAELNRRKTTAMTIQPRIPSSKNLPSKSASFRSDKGSCLPQVDLNLARLF